MPIHSAARYGSLAFLKYLIKKNKSLLFAKNKYVYFACLVFYLNFWSLFSLFIDSLGFALKENQKEIVNFINSKIIVVE